MANWSGIVKQLKKERDLVERHLSGLNAALAAFANVYRGKTRPATRKMSAAARKRISLAQKARWRKVRAKRKTRKN